MPDAPAGPNSIRVLVATDSHVGYNERDAIRGDDSATTFDEVMRLAKERTVDMVLLAGDLFHENNPSRKALNSVMRSLRTNCYGDKPCELELLSDPTEHFDPTFDHVNYEDQDINVAIPVFSIHGNHDDPSGTGHLAALDLLQTCGLINYYGKMLESDNVQIKPVLLQKGSTKLALYGMSNVRDERLHRTFRDGHTRFFQPKTQQENWFNLMSVHQNHVQRTSTATDYLPEEFLPSFMDLIIWGHEHECLIHPRKNPETGFQVIQPGSSVATSLMPGEAVEKHVTILNITGKDFTDEPIRLKTVRPFVMREIVLRDEPGMAALIHKENNRAQITRHLEYVVWNLISEAKQQWNEAQEDDTGEDEREMPKPLIRLRVDYSTPEGGRFDLENPQRFSKRFADDVANTNDVVQFHKKKTATKTAKGDVEMPDEATIAQLTVDTVKVEKLVREFLSAQTLQILPQNTFGDAVSLFVDKDDRHAMDAFLTDTMKKQIEELSKNEGDLDEDQMVELFDKHRSRLEDLHKSGVLKIRSTMRLKPKPSNWDSDMEGPWEDAHGAYEMKGEDDESQEDAAIGEDGEGGSVPPRSAAAKRGGAKATGMSTRKPATASQRTAPKGRGGTSRAGARSKKAVEDDSDEDVVMISDQDEEEPPATRKTTKAATNATSKRAAPAAKKAPARAATAKASQPTGRQTQLNFSQPATQTRQANGKGAARRDLSDDEISDDDAFEPTPATTRSKARR